MVRLAVFLALALAVLTACGGGNLRSSAPAPLIPKNASRAVDSAGAASGLVYVAGINVPAGPSSGPLVSAIYVYQKAALGGSTPSPIRQIFVSPLGQIGLDPAGRLYVSGPSWSIRVFSADASGNAVPTRTFTIPDTSSNAASFTHTIEAFGFLNPDTLAVVLARSTSTTFTHEFDVFHLGSMTLTIVAQLPVPPSSQGEARIAVDGAGDVLILNVEEAAVAQAVVRRFRPAGGSFQSDGVIASASCFEQCAIAASGDNALQVNEVRYCCSNSRAPLTPLATLFFLERGPQFAFDRRGILYAASFFHGSVFQTYAAQVQGQQVAPLSAFTLQLPSQASSVAVTP